MGYTIVITEKGGKPKSEQFEANEITIGRVAENDIVLNKGNISKRHSRIVLRDGKFIIVDLRSTNGTFVNGKRISSPMVLKDADKIYIGDYTLQLEGPEGDDADLEANGHAGAAGVLDPPMPKADFPSSAEGDKDLWPEPKIEAKPEPRVEPRVEPPKAEPRPAPPRADSRREKFDPGADVLPPAMPAPSFAAPEVGLPRTPSRQSAKGTSDRIDKSPKARPVEARSDLPPTSALQARAAVFASVYKNVPAADNGFPPDDEATLERVRSAAEKVLGMQQKRLAGTNTDAWPLQIAREICGLGALTDLLDDDSVSSIYINGPHHILVARHNSAPVLVDAIYSSDEAVGVAVRRLCQAAFVPFDAEHPIAECRLPDGTRINAVHGSVSVRGAVVTIVRQPSEAVTLDGLVAQGCLSQAMADFLALCVRTRQNICVCGGSDASIADVLSALVALVDADERTIVVEQGARLQLSHPNAVLLEPRHNRNTPAFVAMHDLVVNALRMQPGRLVVGDVSGKEALPLVTAMAGPLDGVMFGAFANSARENLDRLETLMRVGGLDVQPKVLREQLAAAVDVIVCLSRFGDGVSRVTQVSEVGGIEVDMVRLQELFAFKRERSDEHGKVHGRFTASGATPRFYDELQKRGVKVDLALFRD